MVGGGSKNYQEIKSGAELILLLRTGATTDNFQFEAYFPALPPDTYCTIQVHTVLQKLYIIMFHKNKN